MKITKKYIFTFSQKMANKPITYQLIKDHNLMVNILNAEITAHKRSYLLVEICGSEESLLSGIRFLEENSVRCEPFKKQLLFDENNCISCGSCTGVCYSKALIQDKSDRNIKFKAEMCTACGLCLKACPLQLLSLNFNSINQHDYRK
jgi:ferredoxin